VRLKCKSYTWDQNLAGTDGVYSTREWSTARRALELADIYRAPTDEHYRGVIRARPDKTALVSALFKELDFSSVGAIGEIGGAPYIQAHQITEKFPSLRYLATDQDEASNAVLSRVPMLSRLDIRNFNVKTDDPAIFDECDWLITFAVDYALSDEELARLLTYVRNKRKSWALLSVSIANLPKYLRLRAGFLQRKLTGTPQRFHGWSRSIDWYHAICRSTGVRLEVRGDFDGYRLLWISG
jgi:hypothetical protein